MLLHHRVPGIDGIYIHEKALIDRLVTAHECVTAAILTVLNGETISKSKENKSRFIDTDDEAKAYYTILPPEEPEEETGR
jgi:hypothetical protein